MSATEAPIQQSDLPIGYRLSDYQYGLPQELIAKYPLPNRDGSRMMVVNRALGTIEHKRFRDLAHYLNPGDALVMNNTKVLPSRFFGTREGHTGKVEVFLLHPLETDTQWRVLCRPANKLKPGTVITFPNTTATMEITATGELGHADIRLNLGEHDSVDAFVYAIGEMPIPPYLERPAEEQDKTTYQTVYAKVPGAKAAPTAGLHFTPEFLQELSDQGVIQTEVTLEVSAGTFRPVFENDITRHEMDPEHYTVSEETAERLRQVKASGKRILTVGTTSTKTLETIAHKFNGAIQADSGWSRLFIYPGFEFKVTDMLLTNFHLPESTLLMLVSAFSNRELMLKAYEEAVKERYRFYSYGDCMLIM